ncbi:uncharacterized protein LOC131598571 [Vicia villosa]|uniref:uncharacterized protein LOC131598571 n=1 Tax=Vicia villosa TaxID=3911 RepID=UPI00273C3C14|nr:uncharacterized protein LOC131598571 [Vicia villosa]
MEEMGSFVLNQWNWLVMEERKDIVGAAMGQLRELEELLVEVSPKVREMNVFKWLSDGKYTVSSDYKVFVTSFIVFPQVVVNMAIVDNVWNTLVRSKIQVFGWRAIRDRLPTREQLAKRGIITEDIDKVCVFRSLSIESLSHLMVDCIFTRAVWQKVALWVGLIMDNHSDMVDHVSAFYNSLDDLVGNRKRLVVWLATCWAIWWMRNEIIFNAKVFYEEDMMNKAILLSWIWNVLGSKAKCNCSFYLRNHSPLEFLILY